MRIQAGRPAADQLHCGMSGAVTTRPSRICFAGLRPSLTAAARWFLLQEAGPQKRRGIAHPRTATVRGQGCDA